MMFTFEDKLEAVRRELKYRRHVYIRRVAEKKMTRELADRQIKLFEEIEADYMKAVDAGRLI